MTILTVSLPGRGHRRGGSQRFAVRRLPPPPAPPATGGTAQAGGGLHPAAPGGAVHFGAVPIKKILPDFRPLRKDGERGKSGDIVTPFSRGNERTYTLARLERDGKENPGKLALAEKVRSGELSANTAR